MTKNNKGSDDKVPATADAANTVSDNIEVPIQSGKLKLSRQISLISYAATLLLTFNWISWYSPPQDVPRALILLILVVPLVLPVRGFLHGRAMSYIAVAMVAMWLFAAGLDIAFYEQNWSALGWALVVCSVVLFISCYFYLRYLPKPDKSDSPSDDSPTEQA